MKIRIMAVLCLLAAVSMAQDMYIGPYEAEAQFDSITTDKVNRIRAQRILFGSRSWGGAVAGAYVSDLGSEYTLNWQSVSLAADDTIAHNAFASPGLVRFRQPDLLPERWTTFADIIRGRNGFKEYGTEIDIAFQFLYSSVDYMWDDYSALFDSLRAEYPDVKFGICTHHISSKGASDIGWNIYGRHYSDSVLAKYRGVVPIIDLSMIAAIGTGGDTATFEYDSKTYPQLHTDWATADQIHLTDYTTMCKAFYMMLDHLTPDTGAYDTAGIAVDSGMINVYVDPSAAGSGNGVDWDNAYTSLAAAELLQRRDLVTADACITFRCRGGVDNGGGVTFSADDWTVDADHFITVEVATEDRHDGTRGTGYVLYPGSYEYPCVIRVPYTVIDGVALDASVTVRGGFRVDAADCVIKNCLLYDIGVTNYSGIYLLGSATGTVVVNNVIYNCAGPGIGVAWCRDTYLYNNTVLNCGRALSVTNHASYPLTVTNCYFGSVAGDSVIANNQSIDGVTFTTTHTSSGEFGTTVTAAATDAGAYFTCVDSGAENVHISYDSELYATATDLGADPVFPFDYDAAGVFRNNGAYSVGAFEVSTVGMKTVLPVPGMEYTGIGNARLHDIQGRPAAGENKGVYLVRDPQTGMMKKIIVVE